jgi:uncharacterized repeat protein (TIGR01451 family)
MTIRRSASALAWLLLITTPALAQQAAGLYGEYFNNNALTAPSQGTVRNDNPTNKQFGNNAPAAPAGMNADNFSIRWTGLINIPATGAWTFYANPDDVARVWIDGVLIIHQTSANTERAGTITLSAGTHPIVMEMIEFGGGAKFEFRWQGPGGVPAKQLVPLANLLSESTAPIVVPAAPTITAGNGGTVPVNGVTMSTSTAGAQIYYTLDNTDPGIGGPKASAILYSGPFNVTQHAVIRARAYNTPLDGQQSPETISNLFESPFAPVAPGSTQAGMYFRYFHTPASTATFIDQTADFDATIPNAPPQQRGIMTTVSNNFTGRDRGDYFALMHTGYITVASSGVWTFYLSSDEGSQLFIQGQRVVENDGMHGTLEKSGQIHLNAGAHPFEIRYFERTGGEALTASWMGPGGTPAKEAIPASAFTTLPVVATPVFTPAAPATFSISQSVTVTCATPGALLYYTLDGSAPDPRVPTSGAGISGLQIPLTSTATIRVAAFAPGLNGSEIASGTFTRVDPYPERAVSSANNTEVVVEFRRPVTPATAQTPGNYTIDNGVGVSAATLLPKTGALLGYWALDDATVADSTGSNAGGTLVNAIVDGSSPLALQFPNPAGLYFNGTTAYATIPDSPAAEVGAGSFTVAAWIRPANLTGDKVIASKWDFKAAAPAAGYPTDFGWSFELTGANLRMRIRDSQNRNYDGNVGSTGLTAGTWRHVAARYDRSTRQVTFFVDGLQIGAPANTDVNMDQLGDFPAVVSGVQPSSNDAPIMLGAITTAATPTFGRFFNGLIDEFRIYRTSLSDGELRVLALGYGDFATAVKLTTSALAPATAYTLTVANVSDYEGRTVAPGGDTVGLRFLAGGAVHMDFFTGFGGTTVPELTRNAAYPYQASQGVSLALWENDTNLDNFGGRVRGYFIPNATGNWRFGVTSDDQGQLWMSPSEDPADRRLVSRSTAWSGYRQYQQPPPAAPAPGVSPVWQSDLIPLVAGQKYYLESLFKEGTGGDHISVAAKLDDGSLLANNAASLPPAQIAPYVAGLRIVVPPLPRFALPGATVAFNVSAEGIAPFAYQWRKDGVNLVDGGVVSGAATRVLTLTGVSTADIGRYDCVVTDAYGSVTSTGALLSVYDLTALPTISSVTPSFGGASGGTLVTVGGTNFLPGFTRVLFDGIDATDVTFVSTTGVTCVVPAHAAGTVDVAVVTHAGNATLPASFTYWNNPTLTLVDGGPLMGPYGPLGGANTVTLTGTNFVAGSTSVTFDGIPATAVVVGSSTSLTCSVPAHAAGVVDVAVTAPGGTATLAGAYEYVAAPTAAGITPADGMLAGGNSFSVTGGALIPGFTRVTFGASDATGVAVVVTRDSLTGTTPAGAGLGTVAVTVTTPGGTSAAIPGGFTYHPVPTAATLDFTTGSTIGGLTVTLGGTGFVSGLTTVTFGGTAGTGVVVTGGTSLTVVTPSHLPGSFDVVVTTPGGQATLPVQFTYTGPFISSISPVAGPSSGLFSATITGVGFTGATSVTFNGVPATITTPGSTTLVVTVPPGVAGPATVLVQTPGGDDDLPGGFTYHDPPTLASVVLAQGPVIGGQTVTLTGTNFVPGFTTVSFGGSAASNIVVGGGNTTLTCLTPARAAGTVDVVVTTFGLTSATLPASYTFVDAPIIGSVLPLRGPTGGGQTVTLAGSNFVPGQTQVRFGGVDAGAVSVGLGGTSLTCSTPAGSGSVTVQVVTFGVQTATAASPYTYVDATTSVDLSVTQVADQPIPDRGEPVLLTVTLANSGPVAGTGIQVLETVPSGATLLSASATQGSYDAATGIWTVGFLAPAGSAVLSLQVTIDVPGPVSMTAEVFACTQADVDSTPNNALAGEDDQATLVFSTVLQIVTPTLEDGTVGAPYWQRIDVRGGVAPYSFSLASGTLPFHLDPATGVISGPGPAAGAYAFTIQVTDSDGPPSTAAQAYTITVNPANPAAPTVNDSPLPPGGTVGTPYDHTFTAVDGQPPYTWSVAAPALPPGLALNARTGRLAGTPTAAGTYTFTLQAASSTGNGTRAFTITIDPPPLAFRTLALPDGAVGQIYNQLVELEGGLGPTFTWSLASGSLPPGLVLTGGTGRTTSIVGTPTINGLYTFTLQAVDGGPSGRTVTRSYGVTILPAGGLALQIQTSSLPPGTIGRPYSAVLTSRGGVAPITWGLSAGMLPAGLTLNPATGLLSGTPAAAGRYEIVVGASGGGSDTQALSLDVAPAPWITTASALPSAVRNEPYAVALAVAGGQPPYGWVAAGALPPGLAIDPYSGMIAGTPTGAGGTFDITVTELNGASDTQTFTLAVLDPGAGLILQADLPAGQVGVPYAATLTALGGTPPYLNFQVTAGSLPAWATLNAATGVLSGIPTLAGSAALSFQVNDSAPGPGIAAAGPVDLVVTDALLVMPLSAPAGSPGVAYTLALTAMNATGATTWQVVSGTLPAGLSLDSLTGVITGTPSTALASFTVRATDSTGRSAERRYSFGGGGAVAGTDEGSGGSSCSLASSGPGGSSPFVTGLALLLLSLRGRRPRGARF